MQLFGKDRSAADAAFAELSSEAQQAIGVSTRNAKLWRRLVARVGKDDAVEQAEVAGLMGAIDAADNIVAESMQKWNTGIDTQEETLDAITFLTEAMQPKVEVAVEAIRHKSTQTQSMAVAKAGEDYYPIVLPTARAYLVGTVTESQTQKSIELKNRWNEACEAWDEVSGRPWLPLVGKR